MPDPISQINTINPNNSEAAAQIIRQAEVSKEFESLLLTRLLSEVGNAISSWDEPEDMAGQQIHGLFWWQLAEYVGKSGGLGLWTQILQQINQADSLSLISKSLDEVL